MSDRAALKARLRAQALAGRAAGGDAKALTARLAAVLADHPGRVVAGYWPIRDEADPRPALARHRGPVVLPVVPGRAQPLIFRLWQGEALQPGSFGTAHPGPDCPVLRPDLVIVPLAGFDRAGHRVGYGGGFYDRTLALLRAEGPVLAVGLAYGVQELPAIPAEPFDAPLDLIVTDRALIYPQLSDRPSGGGENDPQP